MAVLKGIAVVKLGMQ